MTTHLEMLFTGCCLLPGIPPALLNWPSCCFLGLPLSVPDWLHISRGALLAPSLFQAHCGSFGDFRGCGLLY